MMGLFVILLGLKYYYERYVCVLLSWQSLSVNGNAFRDSANRNLRMLLGFGKFHGFATAVWNFALLFHLAGICGKLQPSICGKVAGKDVEIF